jgi:hypothetical protein
MEITEQHTSSDAVAYGNVYVMTHSFFSDVVRIGCTPTDPLEYAKTHVKSKKNSTAFERKGLR